MPYSLRVVLDNLLPGGAAAEDVAAVLAVGRGEASDRGIAFRPSRVLLQVLSGVPALVDLAALRDALAARGGDPDRVNPVVPVDLVVDHSLVVDEAGHPGAMAANVACEYKRNAERYAFLRWAEGAFRNFRVVPPGAGILHQVAVEHLAQVAARDGELVFPETLVGTDSHTTMVNGLGVLGWGVGGIEAEAAMLGLPLVFNLPEVVCVRLTGRLPAGTTATDLVLTLAEALRKAGVVERFVEFTGDALDGALGIPDRATLANMAPEYGATCAFFPVDRATCDWRALTGRDARLVEDHARAQGLWREAGAPEPRFGRVVEIALETIEPSLAGPRRPHERVSLSRVAATHRAAAPEARSGAIPDGAVVIAAITSCTNTSNPDVMLRAGLLARNAAARGLAVPAWVKPSLTPGSRVVARYLAESGLQRELDALGFHLAGFGCATCSGNSGPLAEGVEDAIREQGIAACAVLSGNRNFEGRIHPAARFAWLASPPLVVAYALAGTVARDLTTEPLGMGRDGAPVFLCDIWPDAAEVAALARRVRTRDTFRGCSAMTTSAVAGQTYMAMASNAGLLGQVGVTLRPLAQTSATRSPALPDVPTVQEQGPPGIDARAFWAVVGTAGVPEEIRRRFHAALPNAYAEPNVVARMTGPIGVDVVASTPEEFGAFLTQQMDTWAQVIRDYDIKAD